MGHSFRQHAIYLLFFCILLLVVSFFLQFVLHRLPCPLCIIDRMLVLMIFCVFCVGSLHNPKTLGQQVYYVVGTILSLMGLAVSTRHLWLLFLPPDQVPACGPSVNYLFANLPFHEAFLIVLQGSGECVSQTPDFLGHELPICTFVAFCLLILGNLLGAWNAALKKG